MIDLALLRNDPDRLAESIRAKGVSDVDVGKIRALDQEWRDLTVRVEERRHALNVGSRDVMGLTGSARDERIAVLKHERASLAALEEELRLRSAERDTLLRRIPNPPLPQVPLGKNASENLVLLETARPTLGFSPRSYQDIATDLGIIDTQHAANASGSRFGALFGDGALLEFALVRFAFDRLSLNGFIPVVPPALLKREGLAAMGYLERGEEEMYRTQDDTFLAATSEQSLGALHRDVTFRESDLPRRYVAFSSCFRREAGSYGKDTRGIIRVHQFDKVEMFSFCSPSQSQAEHEQFLALERELMDALEVPYRVLNICTGDLGDPAAAKFDIEAWLPGSAEYRETHSTSNTTDFQTRRLGVTFRDVHGETHLTHAVNGTAFAIGRTIAALLENHQRADGSVGIPEVLRPSLPGRATLTPLSLW